MKKYETYLLSRYRKSTANRYLREFKQFSTYYNVETASREDVLNYIDSLRKKGHSGGSLSASLAGIKAWFNYLTKSNKREDHPCRYLKLKDTKQKPVQLQDLFTTKELESLLVRKNRYTALEKRNRVIIGLLIYQGLTRGELTSLKVKDIDLERAKIHVPASGRNLSRTLSLLSTQILLIHSYLVAERKELLNGRKSDALFITKKGSDESGEGIGYLLETMRDRFKSRKLNPKTVRMSVITNWLSAGLDLRKVQYMAGHRYPSSTERYRQNQVERLKEMVGRFHPLQ